MILFSVIYNYAIYIVLWLINERFREYLAEPLRSISMEFSLRTGVFVLSTDAACVNIKIPVATTAAATEATKEKTQRQHIIVLKNKIRFEVPCYALLTAPIRVELAGGEVFFGFSSSKIQAPGNEEKPTTTSNAAAAQSVILDECDDDDDDGFFSCNGGDDDSTIIEEKRHMEKLNMEISHFIEALVKILQKVQVNIEQMLLHVDDTRTIALHGINKTMPWIVAAAATAIDNDGNPEKSHRNNTLLSVRVDEVSAQTMRGQQPAVVRQTLVTFPGMDVTWGGREENQKLTLTMRGNVQFVLNDEQSTRDWGLCNIKQQPPPPPAEYDVEVDPPTGGRDGRYSVDPLLRERDASTAADVVVDAKEEETSNMFPTWLCVRCEQTIQCSTTESNETINRSSASVVRCVGFHIDNGQWSTREAQLSHGDMRILLQGVDSRGGSGGIISVHSLGIYLFGEKRIAAIRNVTIQLYRPHQQQHIHVLIDGLSSSSSSSSSSDATSSDKTPPTTTTILRQLNVRTTPLQTATLLRTIDSLCTHLSVMFPLEIDSEQPESSSRPRPPGNVSDVASDSGAGISVAEWRPESAAADDCDCDDGLGEELEFCVLREEEGGNGGATVDVQKGTTFCSSLPPMDSGEQTLLMLQSAVDRIKQTKVKKERMPSKQTCPVYVQIRNMLLAWTFMGDPQPENVAAQQQQQQQQDVNHQISSSDAENAKKQIKNDDSLQMCAYILTASYRQCEFPTNRTALYDFPVQGGLCAVLKEWEVRDNVQHSHWRRLFACNGTFDEPATEIRVVQKTRYLPLPSQHAWQVRLRTQSIKVNVHQATYDFIQHFTSSIPCGDRPGRLPGADDQHNGQEKEVSSSSSLSFIECLDIDRVQFIVDYKPHTAKALAEVLRTSDFVYLLRAVPVEGAVIALKPIHTTNVQTDKLVEHLLTLYMPNWNHFVASYVMGVQPLQVALRIGNSVFNLVKMPLMEYRERGADGDVMGVLQDGLRTVTVELMRLGTRASTLSYKILRGADRLLESKTSREARLAAEEKKQQRETTTATTTTTTTISTYAAQPSTLEIGAYESLQHVRRGIKNGIVAVTRDPYRAYKRGGAKSLAKATARSIPRLALQPAIGVAGAVTRMTQAIANVIDPSQKKEADRRWKTK